MGQIFKIERENNQLHELLISLDQNKSDIKDIICILRFRNGDMTLLDSSSFETKCSGSKMLDFMINEELSPGYESDEEYEEDEL